MSPIGPFRMADRDEVVVTPDTLPLGHLASKVVCPTAGAIATFIGTTRDNFEGQRVIRLEVRAACATGDSSRGCCSLILTGSRLWRACAQYEAYIPMAEREIFTIIRTARAKWDLRHVAIAHRIGVVPTAESSVEIAISSTHRKEALAAVQFMIDELKAKVRAHVAHPLRCALRDGRMVFPLDCCGCARVQVPIWKKEVYDGVAPEWKANKESAAPTVEQMLSSGNMLSDRRAMICAAAAIAVAAPLAVARWRR